MATFYVRQATNGRIVGPFSVSRLKTIAAQGKLHLEDDLSRTNTGPWRAVGTVPALKSMFQESKSPSGSSQPSRRPRKRWLLIVIVIVAVCGVPFVGLSLYQSYTWSVYEAETEQLWAREWPDLLETVYGPYLQGRLSFRELLIKMILFAETWQYRWMYVDRQKWGPINDDLNQLARLILYLELEKHIQDNAGQDRDTIKNSWRVKLPADRKDWRVLICFGVNSVKILDMDVLRPEYMPQVDQPNKRVVAPRLTGL